MSTSLIPHQRVEGERSRFAFLIHPRVNVREDMMRMGRRYGLLPNRAYELALARLPIDAPWHMASVRASDRPDEVLGDVLAVPLTPSQLLGGDRRLVRRRIAAAVDHAAGLGATLVGLGALTAPASGGGNHLASRTDVGVTNGNAFTAHVTADAVRRVARGRSVRRVALVGATGSVGSAVARELADEFELLLVGRKSRPTEVLASELLAYPSVEMSDVASADVVVLLTSAVDAVLRPEHVREGAVVVDDTQPRNTSEGFAAARPDVTVIDGGIVRTGGLVRTGHSIGLAPEDSFACLAETALLALSGHVGHGTIGRPTREGVAAMSRAALRFSHLGFDLAPPTGFGRPVTVPGWDLAPAASNESVGATE